MAQGCANMVVPFFGGLPATGTIARTVINIRSGASSPVAGMIHAATLLAIMLAAAPLARHVPLAALAAILLYVAYNMFEWHSLPRMMRFTLSYRVLLLATFVLTVAVAPDPVTPSMYVSASAVGFGIFTNVAWQAMSLVMLGAVSWCS